ncbi:MAG TPA: hypothetical protein VMX13_05675 [Sedimentisphaerales bacterium]|nr:hypothetical protein [Sedimentisphaerales bacterium]
MKRLFTILCWAGELAILAGLLWKHLELYELGWYDSSVLVVLLLFLPLLAYGHWMALRRKRDLSRKVELKLLLLTGPSVFFCVFLIIGLNFELKRAAMTASPNREMLETGRDQGLAHQGFPKWKIERMKSERFIYAMLLASSCILYGNRYSLGKLEYSERPPT